MQAGSYILLADIELVDQNDVAVILPVGTAITCVPAKEVEFETTYDVLCVAMYESHVLGKTDIHDNRMFCIYQRHRPYLIPTTGTWVKVVIAMLKKVKHTTTLDSFARNNGKLEFRYRTEINNAVITEMVRDMTCPNSDPPRIKFTLESPTGTQTLKLSNPYHILAAGEKPKE
jgi:hypothetical protein